ncbi:MAG: YbhN family protein [Corynebacterium sp.]|uniref:lysylphosphatidylglycerol synthase transmembrane domain-containing protein n=1 Tax=Corynebacterium sp. TaxID=1720 RepID=UPI0026DDB916|nr:YbhN family protein [Corynebacterium sp.]MDO5029939.1 YbhN family protein [Corynebacterium sp.]
MSRLKNALTKIGNAGWLRVSITVAIVVVGVVLTVKNWDSVVQGLRILAGVDISWMLFSIVSVAFALFSMAEVMRLLLRAGGVENATRGNTAALTLASNAWSVTVPGGAAFSTALQIKRMMQWGASPVVVSWFVLFSGALSFLGLAFLGVGSLFFVGQGGTTAVLVAIAIVVLLATLLLWRFSQDPTFVSKIGKWGLGVFNKIRKKPKNTDVERLDDVVKQLTSVELPLQTLAFSFFWSFLNWVAEIVCLYAAVRAVGVDDISATKVLLAFVTGKLAGWIQATPGGIGTVEAALTAALVAGGTTGAEAFASVLVYRVVSFVLVAIVGWIIYLLGFDHEGAPETQPESSQVAGS